MIKIIEKEFLDDNFIIKPLAGNINVKDKIYFSKNNIYYFGNYKKDKLSIIKKKIIKNKTNIKNAVEKGIKIIIYGNSIELFNNNFKRDTISLFTAYDKNIFSNHKGKLCFKKNNNKNTFKIIDNIQYGIDTLNFRYKNLLCLKKDKA